MSACVVVGAGSSGAVIAARGTERSDREVLLLEAGPDYEGELPADLRDGTRNSMQAHDWGYRHRPTSGQFLFKMPRGRVVGGSSAVNTCIAVRGQPYDYDEWGFAEWRWEKCLPAFKRLERDLDFPDAPYHGADGPIPLRRHPPSELTRWQGAFVAAAKAMGFPDCPDHNRPMRGGVGPHAMNKIDGERMNAARCYLTAATRARENLRIRARTTVRRVLFSGKRVRGIEVERDGAIEVIEADKVILCGGAIATPGILLRSGIGPRERVERIGVDLVAHLPAVGARLLDHPGAAIFFAPREWLGNLRHPLIQTALRFTSKGSSYRYDMQMQAGSNVGLTHFTLPLVSIMAQVGKPKGAGTIEYRSADPHEKPRIHSRVLEHPDDRARMAEALEIAWLLGTSNEMRPIVAGLFHPSCESTMRSRASIERFSLKSCDSGYHPCGSVPMGEALDEYGRVKGVEGLIVGDASIMPTIPTANTNLPTLMIGERFGEWLREGVI